MKGSFKLMYVLFLCMSIRASADATFKAEVKRMDVGDVTLAYYIRGEGKPLLMINGFLSTMSLWDPALIEELAVNYQLILFDNRGVGLSTDTKENHTTISKMADDVAGLIKNLGYEKVNILAWSMGARIGQQLLIRHPALIEKAILCSANPGGTHADKTAVDIESKLNNPDIPEIEKLSLVFTNDEGGKAAAKNCLARLKEAVAAGTIPNDFTIDKQTAIRQTRARTTLWDSSNENFEALKKIKHPVLLADGRSDLIDLPENSVIIANQIPYSWTAFLDGGHAFLFQSHQQFSHLVHTFLE
ncbi:MAG: alpha/beta fold hydrolase [Parachlamydiaceae bacterium]